MESLIEEPATVQQGWKLPTNCQKNDFGEALNAVVLITAGQSLLIFLFRSPTNYYSTLMINAEVIPYEHQSTTTRTVSQTLPSSALCYNGIRVIPCTRPPVNPLPKEPHFPPLRVNHNANAIYNAAQTSRIEVSSPPNTSRQKSTSTSPTLPPTVFQTPPPRQAPPTPPHHTTVGVVVAAKPTRHVRYRPTPPHHIHPHPYAHAYHQRTTTRPQQQQLSPPSLSLISISTNNKSQDVLLQGILQTPTQTLVALVNEIWTSIPNPNLTLNQFKSLCL
ncbi:hypothetical protein K435DRAFT_811636 [Dendrothele bispora CBS 962.96]|uniref:Uncharacterized protein n=1 Tax=Dendrothele bispora (strain CBS 962.96) TaxID=1314807 RepID=A0A4S8KRU4_DENBC|nr:hypothetical protein K435DRAFT_811636 [Dendrothele bispora CBS 962.96]